MKKHFIYTLAISLLSMYSCSTETSTETEETKTIVGRWTLISEEKAPSNKSAAYDSEEQSMVVLHLQKNGYFMEYDTILEPEWKKKGLHQIERRSKGQYTYQGNTLTLNHSTNDTAYSEVMTVNKLAENELTLVFKNNSATITKTYKK